MRHKVYRAVQLVRDEGVRQFSRSAVNSLTRAATVYYYRALSNYFRLRYSDSLAEPYRLREIHPRDVAALTTPLFHTDLPQHTTHVISGEWDVTTAEGDLYFYGPWERSKRRRAKLPIDQYVFYQSVENHFLRGVPWRETAFYDWITTTDDLPDDELYADEEMRQWRFDQLTQLADSMKSHGYKTQRACASSRTTAGSGAEMLGNSLPDSVPPEYHEVMINIGRDGELLFEEGRHRFSVARALDLDSIPVRVFVRHAAWQEKRSRVARATRASDLPPELRRYLSHPDMVDVAADLSF